MKSAIKTKMAPVKWNKENKVRCSCYGDEAQDGKAIWYDENGNAYELIFARLAKAYSFNPMPAYNK